ncbi:MAG: hypothetical protein AABN33_23925 [Acidobacteriota bacterium]
MHAAANVSLVLTDLSSFKRLADSEAAISYGGFYQLIASGLIKAGYSEQVFREFGERLVVLAEHAHAFRQMKILEQVSQILVSLPLPHYEAVGQYYQAICTQSFGRGDIERAVGLLKGVVESAPARYKVRALISLGANSRHQDDNQSALPLYREASRFATRNGLYDPYATIHTQRMVAVINSEDGNHRGAVALLENLLPLAHSMRRWQPHVYYDYMNSLAVELCEVGRLEEAKNVSQIVLASPFASAYPEWRETRDEIELRGWRASRATIAVNQQATEVRNLVRLPAPERGDTASHEEPIAPPTQQTARVLDLLEWKKKMGKEPNDTPQNNKSFKDMDGREMLLKIMELTGARERTDHELLRILEAIERVLSEPKNDGIQ